MTQNPRELTPDEYEAWAQAKIHEARERAQTGADLVFHGAALDLINEDILINEDAHRLVGEAIINEILDHGYELTIVDGRTILRREN